MLACAWIRANTCEAKNKGNARFSKISTLGPPRNPVMDASKWTEKTRAAVSAAAEAAQRAGCSQVEPVHVAVATLDDPAGIARAAVLRASGDDEGAVAALRRTLQRVASKLPTVRPPPSEAPSISPALVKVLRSALRRMESRKDAYMAMDTLWMACLEDSKVREAQYSQAWAPSWTLDAPRIAGCPRDACSLHARATWRRRVEASSTCWKMLRDASGCRF